MSPQRVKYVCYDHCLYCTTTPKLGAEIEVGAGAALQDRLRLSCQNGWLRLYKADKSWNRVFIF